MIYYVDPSSMDWSTMFGAYAKQQEFSHHQHWVLFPQQQLATATVRKPFLISQLLQISRSRQASLLILQTPYFNQQFCWHLTIYKCYFSKLESNTPTSPLGNLGVHSSATSPGNHVMCLTMHTYTLALCLIHQ